VETDMQAYRIETRVEKDGSLTLQGMPFQAGDEVEVIVLARARSLQHGDRYPLRGQPIRYEDPTEPVAESDWEILR
jgi:hypothetical protein